MCQDRVDWATLDLTQEFIAEMLGSRRGTVNVTAITLHSAGLIKYNRGHITTLDRQELETIARECYELLKSRDDD